MKFVLAGIGKMGKLHYEHLLQREDVELRAVIDPDEKSLSSIDGKIKKYKNFKEIDEGFDAAIVATPTKNHEEITNYFLEKNINVLVEKPISNNIQSAEEMVKTAKKMNKVLMIGYIERHNPMIKTLMNEVENEKIESIYTSRWAPRPKRIMYEGVVLDSMIHDIDIILQFIGEKVSIEDAYGNLGDDEYPDNAKVVLKNKKNMYAHLFSGWETKGRHRTLLLSTKENIYLGDYIKQTLIKINKKENIKNELKIIKNKTDAIDAQITKFKENIIQKNSYQESLKSLEIVLDSTKKIIEKNKNE
tara:strand:+ start:167 stop:1075 length:909 start_codon:yes stop_codon:yes gene_type:complete